MADDFILLLAALDEAKKVMPADWATRWTVQIDGPRLIGLDRGDPANYRWDAQSGRGPSLTDALLDLKRRLETNAP